ncbi:hypothetical protein ACSBOB_07125 [Mesorhizobium sp. ASY16-5R]|uniref:hypothetical protein n=1 Tax=Mesorhizobium sp. ASY16-5R TaxID=3445772 RepID=UPI003F9F2B60
MWHSGAISGSIAHDRPSAFNALPGDGGRPSTPPFGNKPADLLENSFDFNAMNGGDKLSSMVNMPFIGRHRFAWKTVAFATDEKQQSKRTV